MAEGGGAGPPQNAVGQPPPPPAPAPAAIPPSGALASGPFSHRSLNDTFRGVQVPPGLLTAKFERLLLAMLALSLDPCKGGEESPRARLLALLPVEDDLSVAFQSFYTLPGVSDAVIAQARSPVGYAIHSRNQWSQIAIDFGSADPKAITGAMLYGRDSEDARTFSSIVTRFEHALRARIPATSNYYETNLKRMALASALPVSLVVLQFDVVTAEEGSFSSERFQQMRFQPAGPDPPPGKGPSANLLRIGLPGSKHPSWFGNIAGISSLNFGARSTGLADAQLKAALAWIETGAIASAPLDAPALEARLQAIASFPPSQLDDRMGFVSPTLHGRGPSRQADRDTTAAGGRSRPPAHPSSHVQYASRAQTAPPRRNADIEAMMSVCAAHEHFRTRGIWHAGPDANGLAWFAGPDEAASDHLAAEMIRVAAGRIAAFSKAENGLWHYRFRPAPSAGPSDGAISWAGVANRGTSGNPSAPARTAQTAAAGSPPAAAPSATASSANDRGFSDFPALPTAGGAQSQTSHAHPAWGRRAAAPNSGPLPHASSASAAPGGGNVGGRGAAASAGGGAPADRLEPVPSASAPFSVPPPRAAAAAAAAPAAAPGTTASTEAATAAAAAIVPAADPPGGAVPPPAAAAVAVESGAAGALIQPAAGVQPLGAAPLPAAAAAAAAAVAGPAGAFVQPAVAAPLVGAAPPPAAAADAAVEPGAAGAFVQPAAVAPLVGAAPPAASADVAVEPGAAGAFVQPAEAGAAVPAAPEEPPDADNVPSPGPGLSPPGKARRPSATPPSLGYRHLGRYAAAAASAILAMSSTAYMLPLLAPTSTLVADHYRVRKLSVAAGIIHDSPGATLSLAAMLQLGDEATPDAYRIRLAWKALFEMLPKEVRDAAEKATTSKFQLGTSIDISAVDGFQLDASLLSPQLTTIWHLFAAMAVKQFAPPGNPGPRLRLDALSSTLFFYFKEPTVVQTPISISLAEVRAILHLLGGRDVRRGTEAERRMHVVSSATLAEKGGVNISSLLTRLPDPSGDHAYVLRDQCGDNPRLLSVERAAELLSSSAIIEIHYGSLDA